MENYAIYATMQAKEGREEEVEAFLGELQKLANREEGTKHWFALRRHDRTYSIFDTFGDQESRGSHLNGQIAQALKDHASSLFEGVIDLVILDVIAEKDEKAIGEA